LAFEQILNYLLGNFALRSDFHEDYGHCFVGGKNNFLPLIFLLPQQLRKIKKIKEDEESHFN